jgi:DNA-binding transcriptional regulator YhcF (GntR family)
MPRPPIIRIDLSSKVAAYEQIASEIRALLVAGDLRPGDALPTVRQLAVDLNVHHNTVAQAYRILADEGWLDIHRGRGARVVPRTGHAPKNSGAKDSFSRQLRRLAAKAASEGIPPKAIAQELKTRARQFSTLSPSKGHSR